MHVCQGQRIHQAGEMCLVAAGKGTIAWPSVSSPISLMVGALDRFGWTVQARETLSVSEYCVIGNHKLKMSRQKRSLHDLELLVSETCSLVKAATPQGCTTLPGGPLAFASLELQITQEKSHLQVQ